jgi:hypothetical protein
VFSSSIFLVSFRFVKRNGQELMGTEARRMGCEPVTQNSKRAHFGYESPEQSRVRAVNSLKEVRALCDKHQKQSARPLGCDTV